MLSLQNSQYLIGLLIALPLTLLFLFVLRWKKKVKKEMGDASLIDSLTKNYSARLFLIKFIIVLLAIITGIFAAANLCKPAPGNNDKRAGIDVMIALDVSKSMLSEDIKPSRLERAKQCVNLLIDQLNDNRIGLVLFAGQAFLQMPLTADAEASKMYISNASPDAVPVQGTDVGDALRLCDNSLDTKERKYKAIILISDGEDHDPKSDAALTELYNHGVVVYTIGIGTAEGSPIIEPGTNVYKTDVNGQTVISKLNETELKNIAQKTGGNYFHLDNSLTTANEVAAALNNMDKKVFAAGGGDRTYTSFFPFFIAFTLLLLIAEIFVPETKKKLN
ncbi:MAG: VWA domain-containing protein [Chitinophagaceae bacterium]